MQGVQKIAISQAAFERVASRAASRAEVLSQEEMEQRAGLVCQELPYAVADSRALAEGRDAGMKVKK